MGLLAKFKEILGKKKEEKEEEDVSTDVSKEETDVETREKQEKKQTEVPEEQLKKIAETSKFASNVDNRLEEIDMGIREIKKEMAKEETLKEVKEDVVNKSTMKDLLENVMLKQGMKYLQGDVSKVETDSVSKETKEETDLETSSETKKYIQETSKKKAKEFAEEIEDIEKYKKAKDKVKKALKDQGKVKFGNDNGDYGLTKLTGLERSWIYKVCYLGFDSSGSVKDPAEGTLLDEGKISIDKSGRAFKVVWNK